MKTLLSLIEQQSGLAFREMRSQKRHVGPCPFCKEGEDRFQIYHESNRYWCRRCKTSGDAIDFLRRYRGLSFTEARQYLGLSLSPPHHNNHNNHKGYKGHNHHKGDERLKVRNHDLIMPDEAWQEQGWPLVFSAIDALYDPKGEKALAWLAGRQLPREILTPAAIGYYDQDPFVPRAVWGLSPVRDKKSGRLRSLFLPRGITIPWMVDGELAGIRFRRPKNGKQKYYWIPGGTTPCLYNSDRIQAKRPVVLVEGELDALTIMHQAGEPVAAVATGSTEGARHVRWLARLATASVVLVAFDSDEAGDTASNWWTDVLSNARRWRPFWADANTMAQDGVDLRTWITQGLHNAGIQAAGIESEMNPETKLEEVKT